MKHIILTILFYCLLAPLLAQIPSLNVEETPFTGAYYNDVHSDKDGFIWVVHQSQIVKYDGTKKITISDRNIDYHVFLRLKETKSGKKYVIDSYGQIFFIEADTLRAFEHNHKLKEINIKGGFNDFYLEENGRLHISFYHTGYTIIDNGKVIRPLEEKGIEIYGIGCVMIDDNLPLMIYGRHDKSWQDRELFMILFDKEMHIIDRHELKEFRQVYSPSIARLKGGDFLFASGERHLFRFNRDRIIEETHYDNSLIGIFVDSKMGLWVSSSDNVIDYYEEGIIDSTKKNSIQGYFTPQVTAEDIEGGMWFRSDQGVQLITEPTHKILSKNNGYFNSNIINGLTDANGKLIVTAGHGSISTIDVEKNHVTSITIPSLVKKKGGPYYYTYDKNNERLWASMRGDIGYIQDQEFYPINKECNGEPFRMNGVVSHFSSKVYQKEKEVDFITYFRDRFFFVHDTVVSFFSERLPTKRILDVLVVEDSTFICSLDGLFLQCDDKIINLEEQFPALTGTVIHANYFDNKVWISMLENGLFTLSGNTLDTIILNTTNQYIKILQVGQEEMWALSAEYSAYIQPKESGVPHISYYAALGKAYNYNINEKGTFISALQDNNRIRLVGTADIRKDSIIAPRPVILKLRINNKDVPISNTTYQLEYDEGFIQINYTGLSFQGKSISYRHRMRGLNDEWIESEERSIQYTTLPAGNYQFEYQTRRQGEPWGNSQSLYFEISPPIWEKWWFIMGVAFLLLVIIFQIVAYRFRILQREQKLTIDRLLSEQKALRAQMDPHYVFNIVASVQYLIMSSANERAIKFLNMFSKSLRGILDQSSNNSIRIVDEINFLREYVEMERFRLEGRFDYTINQTSIVEVLERRIPTFMIQPFIENAIKHGIKNKEERGNLLLEFSYEGDFLELRVIDDGVGRDASRKFKLGQTKLNHKSYGVKLIKERLQLHNSRSNNVKVIDLKDKHGVTCGTEVTLTIKML